MEGEGRLRRRQSSPLGKLACQVAPSGAGWIIVCVRYEALISEPPRHASRLPLLVFTHPAARSSET